SSRERDDRLQINSLPLEFLRAEQLLQFRSMRPACRETARRVFDDARRSIFGLEQPKTGSREHRFINSRGHELHMSLEGPPSDLFIGKRPGGNAGIGKEKPASRSQDAHHFAKQLRSISNMNDRVERHQRVKRARRKWKSFIEIRTGERERPVDTERGGPGSSGR